MTQLRLKRTEVRSGRVAGVAPERVVFHILAAAERKCAKKSAAASADRLHD